MLRLSGARRALLTMTTATALGACAARAPSGPPYDAALGLQTFDAAWRIVYETHFDTTFNGVDWVALRDSVRPHAASATSASALRGVITNMLDRLGQSHFAIFPKELADTLDPGADSGGARTGDLGLDFRLIGEELVVTSVEAGSPADAAGVRPGWVIEAVNGRSVADLLERLRARNARWPVGFLVWSAAHGRLGGTVGTACSLTVRDGADRARELVLTRRQDPSEPVKFGSLPTFFARFASHDTATAAGRPVSVIWFNFWMVPLIRQVDSAMDAARAADGIVMDLRGNRGGLGGMIVGVSGHFFDTRATLGTFRYRQADLKIVANPRRVSQRGERVQPYDGPVAVLVDEASASASEVFAGGMQALERVRVFGATTLGGVLPAVWDRLPNGDVLYHAIAEFITSTGVVLEGRGVVPDDAVPLTRGDLLAGRDRVMDAALAWIDAVRAKEARAGSEPEPRMEKE